MPLGMLALWHLFRFTGSDHGSSDAYDVCDVILRTRTTESQGSRTYFSAIRV